MGTPRILRDVGVEKIEVIRSQPTLYLGWFKTEPEIGLTLSETLVVVFAQIDDKQLSPGLQRSMGLGDGPGGIRHMMQDHAGHDGLYLTIGHRQMSQIPQPKVAAPGLVSGRMSGHIQHLRR